MSTSSGAHPVEDADHLLAAIVKLADLYFLIGLDMRSGKGTNPLKNQGLPQPIVPFENLSVSWIRQSAIKQDITHIYMGRLEDLAQPCVLYGVSGTGHPVVLSCDQRWSVRKLSPGSRGPEDFQLAIIGSLVTEILKQTGGMVGFLKNSTKEVFNYILHGYPTIKPSLVTGPGEKAATEQFMDWALRHCVRQRRDYLRELTVQDHRVLARKLCVDRLLQTITTNEERDDVYVVGKNGVPSNQSKILAKRDFTKFLDSDLDIAALVETLDYQSLSDSAQDPPLTWRKNHRANRWFDFCDSEIWGQTLLPRIRKELISTNVEPRLPDNHLWFLTILYAVPALFLEFIRIEKGLKRITEPKFWTSCPVYETRMSALRVEFQSSNTPDQPVLDPVYQHYSPDGKEENHKISDTLSPGLCLRDLLSLETNRPLTNFLVSVVITGLSNSQGDDVAFVNPLIAEKIRQTPLTKVCPLWKEMQDMMDSKKFILLVGIHDHHYYAVLMHIPTGGAQCYSSLEYIPEYRAASCAKKLYKKLLTLRSKVYIDGEDSAHISTVYGPQQVDPANNNCGLLVLNLCLTVHAYRDREEILMNIEKVLTYFGEAECHKMRKALLKLGWTLRLCEDKNTSVSSTSRQTMDEFDKEHLLALYRDNDLLVYINH